MNKQMEHIEDPEEVKILRAINRDEIQLENVDWKTWLSSLVNMVELLNKTPKPVSYIGSAWALLIKIDDYARRADILAKWQSIAPQCFPSKEAADAFYSDAQCLKDVNYRLRGLVLHGAQMPHTYDKVFGGKGLNEMALLWADEHVKGSDMMALASEIHVTVSAGAKDPVIEYFLYSSRHYNELVFENIYDFSRNLFLAESFRKHLVLGKMCSKEPLVFTDIKRRLRNACFEEYIRLRIAQIEEEMENDNELLLDPTIEDVYQELYKQERSVVNREVMFEDFRGSQAYHDRWYKGRPEVLRMIQYFIEYLKWKIANLHSNPQPQNNTTYNVQGDYIAGDKHVGAHIDNVESGGIGTQTTKE